MSQRYEELYPGIRIHWDKRTLDEFGHKPIDQLIHDYDLIVIDHPWAGFCFDHNLVCDQKTILSQDQWNNLEENCIGPTFKSYIFDDKLLAIPIDAATPVPSWRPDLVEKNDLQIPGTWDELISLADKKHAVMPGFGADLFLNWLMLLHALDAKPFESPDNIALRSKAIEAASLLKRLAEPMPKEIMNWNPIIIAELMTQQDLYSYCPFAYSYGNYCRPSFVSKPLQYGNLVRLNEQPLKSILGGTGIAISLRCKEIEVAVNFSLYCASAEIQSNIYTYAGGQAVRKEAWNASNLRSFTGGFFADSYLSHENALVRPRYKGYVGLQEKAGSYLQQFLKKEISEAALWNEIQDCYHKSQLVKV